MTQVDSLPSADSCTRLLRALPVFSAFKRTLRDAAPPDTQGWLGALYVVARHEAGVRPSGVADQLMVDLSVASRSITQLEELGYVERTRDPEDGRAWIVHATGDGRARLELVTAGFAQHIRTLLPDWTDDELDSFTAQLRRFGTALIDAAAASDPPEELPA